MSKTPVYVFLSYSHHDEALLECFNTQIAPLTHALDLKIFYDRKVHAGKLFWEEIDKSIGESDIIILFISANYLASTSCRKEKDTAYQLNKDNGTIVIPIILSKCGWADDPILKKTLNIPTDGKPVLDFNNKEDAWHDVYGHVKPLMETASYVNNLRHTEHTLHWLEDVELLTQSHPRVGQLRLQDIYVDPELELYDDLGDYTSSVQSDTILDKIKSRKGVIISGDDQSGKTCLCKNIYNLFAKNGYIPVYVNDKINKYSGNISTLISNAINDQYIDADKGIIPKEKIVLIIDDFHASKHRQKIVDQLENFPRKILIVDDIFTINLREELLVDDYIRMSIKEYKPSLRYEIIRKWVNVTGDKNQSTLQDIEAYKRLDEGYQFINETLGRILGDGIVPSYPFFIITILSEQDSFGTKTTEEVSSQGHCYQALIYIHLRKNGVSNEDVDSHINFLAEFAYYLFKNKLESLDKSGFDDFFEDYTDKYIPPDKPETTLDTLIRSNIIRSDSFSHYSFRYPYIFYYFIAKYLSDHITERFDTITTIVDHLHENQNAYISIFLVHHSKKPELLNLLMDTTKNLFTEYKPTGLSRSEIMSLDRELSDLVNQRLPSPNESVDENRRRKLEAEDELENSIKQNQRDNEDSTNQYADGDDTKDDAEILIKDLRKSIKTVEVLGRIIKNRHGSLKIDILEQVFQNAMEVHLRILTSYLKVIERSEGSDSIISFLVDRLKNITNKGNKHYTDTQLKDMARTIYWNFNLILIHAIFVKIVQSLGADKLRMIVENVCQRDPTPAKSIIKHGILMWYSKSLQIDEIEKDFINLPFSKAAKRVMRLFVINYCRMHSINFKDRQRLESKLGFSSKRLLNESNSIRPENKKS